jgi:hypothetical protein
MSPGRLLKPWDSALLPAREKYRIGLDLESCSRRFFAEAQHKAEAPFVARHGRSRRMGVEQGIVGYRRNKGAGAARSTPIVPR